MLEVALLGILALSFVGGYLLSPRRQASIPRSGRVGRTGFARSEPADEGAAIPEGEPDAPGSDRRRAA